MALYTPYHAKGAGPSQQTGTTEFEILKNSHKFLRNDDEADERQLSWDEKVAKKYYSSLYREYAVCDLKHYKSGNFALRWRTESEVLSGAGETTCGNTRCPLHQTLPDEGDDVQPALTTLELPFAYEEQGESKFALVKVVLCAKCCRKLMWKRNKDKERRRRPEDDGQLPVDDGRLEDRPADARRERRASRSPPEEDATDSKDRARCSRNRRDSDVDDKKSHTHRRSRNDRSRSPRRRHEQMHECP